MKPAGSSLPIVIGAMGVVYGDIGTSPLYAMETALTAAGSPLDRFVILGVLSWIFWSLAVVVTLKYVVLIMRADNDGEGGILALFALVQRTLAAGSRWLRVVVVLAALGAALFYCDTLITPAISVLSAVEGLENLNAQMTPAVVPVTLIIIILLFAIQYRGTEKVGRLFGPIMFLWFIVLGVTGTIALVRNPAVLVALNPTYAAMLLARRPGVSLAILGGVFLAVTGGEALYADMGQFGRRPVRIAWTTVVWPALILSYFGQGARILSDPRAAHLPVYQLVSPALLPLMIVLATAATIIASQATITGAFSVTRQCIQLDLLPRLRITQTSAHEHSQIYVPVVNWFVMIAVSLFVLAFRSSAALGAAYGAAVSGTMLITTLLGMQLALAQWRWRRGFVSLVFGPLMLVDTMFVIGNLSKFAQGAWVPLTLAVALFSVFMVWRSGRRLLRLALRAVAVPLSELPQLLAGIPRVPGTAVFLASDPKYVPTAMLRNLEHNHVAHQRIVLLNMEIARSPRFDPAGRVRIDQLMPDIYTVTARFGFMERPDVSEALKLCRARGLKLFAQDCSFFLGWHLVVPRPRGGYEGLRRRLFAWMQRRSTQAVEFFRMPDQHVIVLATQVEL
ncbi:MAG TPA: KUP/HAK/KT family potassium transporter [Steroidobacteraceae bacterium]|nr:KUP/HAK/KT family potassium transporter [Steroidobacteraceae bacterium]